ncbi:MAG: 50S ribosomal protein L4 [Myxococcota bacterium]|nr:50S ribosomal protein L4 [Myxococcota bacterium]
MATFPVYDLSKKQIGSIDLSDVVFAAEVNENTIYEVVKMQQARNRAGTVMTKHKALVSGGGKKPWKQKGSGRARAGSIRSPLWRGGGVIFGPQPRDWSYDVNKKVKRGALCSAISQRASQGKLLILDNFELNAIKTKALAGVLKTLGVDNALIVDGENERLALSSRNLPDIKVTRPDGVNVLDVLRFKHLVLTRPSAKAIEGRLT